MQFLPLQIWEKSAPEVYGATNHYWAKEEANARGHLTLTHISEWVRYEHQSTQKDSKSDNTELTYLQPTNQSLRKPESYWRKENFHQRIVHKKLTIQMQRKWDKSSLSQFATHNSSFVKCSSLRPRTMEWPKENTGKMLPGIDLCKATLDMTSTAEAAKGTQVYRWDYLKPQSFPCAAKETLGCHLQNGRKYPQCIWRGIDPQGR